MSTLKIVNVDTLKRLQMDRLLTEARRFNLRIAEVNDAKPWGGYLRFTQDSLANFMSAYWLNSETKVPIDESLVDPKVLLVAPGKMLSLQWHKRRSERWRIIDGPVRIVKGHGWNSLKHKDCPTGEVIDIPQTQWHRLIGLSNWCRVAEIWLHTNRHHPSDERDTLRVHDKYQRADPAADPSTPIGERDAKWAEFEKTYS